MNWMHRVSLNSVLVIFPCSEARVKVVAFSVSQICEPCVLSVQLRRPLLPIRSGRGLVVLSLSLSAARYMPMSLIIKGVRSGEGTMTSMKREVSVTASAVLAANS